MARKRMMTMMRKVKKRRKTIKNQGMKMKRIVMWMIVRKKGDKGLRKELELKCLPKGKKSLK